MPYLADFHYPHRSWREEMPKSVHEIRDPIHVFLHLDSHERRVVDSFPFQRLRHIHQLALSHLVYPGATHKRFEHSLGVMELAGRAFDVVTNPDNLFGLPEKARRGIPRGQDELGYWRKVVRMAAMCHDVGHLPFSHAAEHELLPEGWDHERLSVEIIRCEEMLNLWKEMKPPLNPDDIAKIAVGSKKVKHLGAKVVFSDWDRLLSEIIVGDALGVDRMDYLLRDSHHAGVPYGRFDHFRLLETLRILPSGVEGASDQPFLGVEEGGLHTAEGLLLARYFMYSQVYMHPVRRVYDIHLKDFLQSWLPGGRFATDVPAHLAMTDNEATAAMYAIARGNAANQPLARRVICREHFREVYRRAGDDINLNAEPGKAVFNAMRDRYGADNVRHDDYIKADPKQDFPVLMRNDQVSTALKESVNLRQIPAVITDYVFVHPDVRQDAVDWLKDNKRRVLETTAPKEEA